MAKQSVSSGRALRPSLHRISAQATRRGVSAVPSSPRRIASSSSRVCDYLTPQICECFAAPLPLKPMSTHRLPLLRRLLSPRRVPRPRLPPFPALKPHHGYFTTSVPYSWQTHLHKQMSQTMSSLRRLSEPERTKRSLMHVLYGPRAPLHADSRCARSLQTIPATRQPVRQSLTADAGMVPAIDQKEDKGQGTLRPYPKLRTISDMHLRRGVNTRSFRHSATFQSVPASKRSISTIMQKRADILASKLDPDKVRIDNVLHHAFGRIANSILLCLSRRSI